MTELLALGASHKTAPLAVRERIALTDTGAERFVRELCAHETIGEAVALSTCNRTELYLLVRDPVEAESAVLALLARRAGIRPTELLDGIYSLRNCDAARQLYRVARRRSPQAARASPPSRSTPRATRSATWRTGTC